MRPASVSQSTYERLREIILQRRLPPGSPLHEKKLAEALGVSRTPVREGLSRLINEGLVSHYRGGTPVVRRLSVTEFIEVLYIRRLLEIEAAGRAAACPHHEALLDLRSQLVSFLNGPRPSAEEHRRVDDTLHRVVAGMTGSKLIGSMIEELRMKTHIFDMGLIPERFGPGVLEHLEIIDAIVAQDVTRSQQAMKAHIDGVRESIVGNIKRQFEEQSGTSMASATGE